MKIIISGGRQSKSSLSYFNKEWSSGVSGVIFEYDSDSKKIEEMFTYETPKNIELKKIIVYLLKVGLLIITNFILQH